MDDSTLGRQDRVQALADLYPVLFSLNSPSDAKNLDMAGVQALAEEVRSAILREVSQTGGHFSSNLGAVELAVAICHVFDLEKDHAVWDTGHQAYAHKILTGRLPQFDGLRKFGGISGFLRREESPYDAFGAGHAGTAISAALGFAIAAKAQGKNEKAIAIVGDASIASGMSWEALNHAGAMDIDLIVILNDNRMSIAPNVGALKNYLAKLRSRPQLQNLAKTAKGVVQKMPDPVGRVAAGLRHGITHYLAPEPTGTIFEEMGFEYIGPVDGHDLSTLVDVLKNVKELHGPILIHALTVKGKGYKVSEDDARKWHAVTPFDLDSETQVKPSASTSFMSAFGDAAVAAAEKDEKVVAITAAMPDGTGLTEFAEKFPDRFFDVGIAEQHAVTLAAGMAAGGLKPFCAIYSTFLQRGFDQVIHDVCLQKLPVRFFLDRAGLVGDDGPTHHGVFDLSYLSLAPNMVILAPSDASELHHMVEWARLYEKGPCAVRYPRGAIQLNLADGYKRSPIEIGRSELLREGSDIAILAIGSCVGPALAAAQILEPQSIRAAVLNLRFAKPLDHQGIINLAMKTGVVLVAEENSIVGGVGEAIVQLLQEAGLSAVRIGCAAIPDQFVEHGTQPILRKLCGLDAESLAGRALELLGRQGTMKADVQLEGRRSGSN